MIPRYCWKRGLQFCRTVGSKNRIKGGATKRVHSFREQLRQEDHALTNILCLCSCARHPILIRAMRFHCYVMAAIFFGFLSRAT
ncbi:hypothetical protein MTO96_044959 [Rhipicephalus appendiculatus]